MEVDVADGEDATFGEGGVDVMGHEIGFFRLEGRFAAVAYEKC